MASHEPGRCCTIGVRHEGAPKGKLQVIEGKELTKDDLAETYVATPQKPHPEKAILYFTDVIGHRLNNAQLIADQFAANGYLTHVPDLFHGDAIPLNRPEGFDLMKWLKGAAGGGTGEGHLPDRVEPVVKAAIKHLREQVGVKRLAVVGYCFGAKYVILSLQKDYGADVGYIAHPSFVEKAELSNVAFPLSIAAAETDQQFPANLRHESEEILKEIKVPYQISLYSGVSHGFAVRGDISDKVVRYAKETAFVQAVQWFDEWL